MLRILVLNLWVLFRGSFSRPMAFIALVLAFVAVGSLAGTTSPLPSSPGAPPIPPATAAAPDASAASAPAAALPPHDNSCGNASDYGYAHSLLIEGKCCDGTYSPKPASQSWLAATQAQGKKLGWDEQRCPAKKVRAAARVGVCLRAVRGLTATRVRSVPP